MLARPTHERPSPHQPTLNIPDRPTTRKLWVVFAVLLLLRLPVLGWGFGFDDYTHQWVLSEDLDHATLGPATLFEFGDAPAEGTQTFNRGIFPFWTDQDMSARFLRPITSLSITLDHALFGTNALGYHLIQLAGFALLLILLRRFYLHIGLSPWLAVLAVVIFGVEDGSTPAVGWIANRSTLIAAIGFVIGLHALHRARTTDAGKHYVVATLGALLALGAKESGIGMLAVIVVGSCFRLHPDWRQRTRRGSITGITVALLILIYGITYVSLGYGTRTAFYPTPWTDMQGFLKFQALHLTSGLATSCGPFITDLAVMHESMRPSIIAVGTIVLALLARPVARSVRELPAGPLLLIGALLGFGPQLLAAPSDRLIFVPMIGFAPLLATTIRRGLRSTQTVRRIGARTLVGTTLILSPLSMLAVQNGLGLQMRLAREWIGQFDKVEQEVRDVVLLQAPFGTMMLSFRAQFIMQGGDPDLRFWPIQFNRRALRLSRPSADQLVIETLDESFMTLPFEYVYRSSREVPALGKRYPSVLFDAVVMEVDETGPRKIEFTIRAGDGRNFDDESIDFRTWDGTAFVSVLPPAIGQELELVRPPEPFPFAP
ncbi:MAG: hypothetical protein ACI841_004427 [Planctomycetota bacterium]|jgi:hypothetical protein